MNLLKSSVILILAIGTVIHGLALTQVQAAVPRTPDELSNALQQIETLEAAVTVDISKASVLQAGYCEIVYGSAVLKDTIAAWDLLGRLADLDRRTGLQTVHPDLSLAAMSLYRQLKQQSEDDRYETLHEWTFPQSPQNNGLRSLIIMTPTTAPPPEFARAIGERPTRDAFPVPAAGLSAGTFSTLWLLIEAADQTGHLRTLQRELLAARNSGDPTAAFALMLLNIKAEERAANVLEEIKSRLTSTEVPTNRLPPNGHRNAEPIDVSERFLLSAAALLHRDLRADGLASLQTLSVQQRSGGLRLTRSRIQNLLLRGLSLHASAGDERVTEAEAMQMSDQFWKSASLRHWIPVTVPDATRRMPEHSAGLDRSIWLPADEQLMHLCGGDVDFLLFRYPLTGDFTFSVDGQESGPDAMASGVIWSGHAARPGANQSTGYLTLTTPDKKYETEHVCPFLVHQAASQFHRMQVMFANGRSSLLINGQTMWTEAAVPQPSERTSDASPAGCPWIGLRSSCEVRPLFRNIRITGHPIIPGDVRLSDSHLNAWITASTTETRPTDFSPRSSGLLNLLTQPSTDWTLSGETISRRPTNNTPAQTTGSRLYHLRPLQDGERLSYQFWCDEVPCIHPTVGPLSFVLSADDVQLRWIVDSELHWTGLSPENAIRDPLAQRNRGPLPIHKKSWNDVRISLENSVVQLHLNETLVLEKELSADGNLHFGFQTFNSDSTARVRRVVLSGNWPATLSENIVQSLTETMSPLNERQQLAVERLFQDHDLAENVAQFRKKAAPLEPQQRYQVLCDWVLPSKHRPTFRLNGHFSPLSPAPSVAEFTPEEQQRIVEAEANEERCVLVGGSLFSAAFDLIDVASELGQLDQLRQLIVDSEAITSESSADMHSQRSRLALLVLIDLKAGRDQIAVESLQKFIEAVKNDPIRTPARRWPEMLVFWKAVRHPQTATLANEALFQFVYRDLHDGSGTGSQAWDRQLLALMGFRTLLETPGHHPEEYLQALPTKQWSAASFEWAMTRGQGMPGSRYMFDDHELRQLSGHENDFLYFQSPLRGNYDIDCLTTTFDWQECEMFFNGHWAGPAWGMTHYESGDHRRSYRKQSLGPKLPNEVGRWFHVRIQSRDGIARIFANGRQLYEEPLLPDHDPWIGGRFWHRYHGAIRDVRITGNPDIPDSIRLLHDEALTGWSAYYETRNFERLENWSY